MNIYGVLCLMWPRLQVKFNVSTEISQVLLLPTETAIKFRYHRQIYHVRPTRSFILPFMFAFRIERKDLGVWPWKLGAGFDAAMSQI